MTIYDNTSHVAAFNAVTDIYDKTSFLLTSFTNELETRGFGCPNYQSNFAGPDGRAWLMRCIELHFKPKQEADKKSLIAVMISFSNIHTGEIVEPCLVAGILEHGGNNEGWLYDAYYNKGDEYAYKPKDEWKEDEITKFTHTLDDQKKSGCLFAKSLSQVNDIKAVKALSEKLVQLRNDFEAVK